MNSSSSTSTSSAFKNNIIKGNNNNNNKHNKEKVIPNTYHYNHKDKIQNNELQNTEKLSKHNSTWTTPSFASKKANNNNNKEHQDTSPKDPKHKNIPHHKNSGSITNSKLDNKLKKSSSNHQEEKRSNSYHVEYKPKNNTVTKEKESQKKPNTESHFVPIPKHPTVNSLSPPKIVATVSSSPMENQSVKKPRKHKNNDDKNFANNTSHSNNHSHYYHSHHYRNNSSNNNNNNNNNNNKNNSNSSSNDSHKTHNNSNNCNSKLNENNNSQKITMHKKKNAVHNTHMNNRNDRSSIHSTDNYNRHNNHNNNNNNNNNDNNNNTQKNNTLNTNNNLNILNNNNNNNNSMEYNDVVTGTNELETNYKNVKPTTIQQLNSKATKPSSSSSPSSSSPSSSFSSFSSSSSSRTQFLSSQFQSKDDKNNHDFSSNHRRNRRHSYPSQFYQQQQQKQQKQQQQQKEHYNRYYHNRPRSCSKERTSRNKMDELEKNGKQSQLSTLFLDPINNQTNNNDHSNNNNNTNDNNNNTYNNNLNSGSNNNDNNSNNKKKKKLNNNTNNSSNNNIHFNNDNKNNNNNKKKDNKKNLKQNNHKQDQKSNNNDNNENPHFSQAQIRPVPSSVEDNCNKLLGMVCNNQDSEEVRWRVFRCIARVLRRADMQTFLFGSVALKTYLPHGDIDISVFPGTPRAYNDRYQSTPWFLRVRGLLAAEGRRQGSLPVEEVNIINADVKVVKCIVGGVHVDISWNQLGGISTLCFFENVDRRIGYGSLFKRSVLLAKAWCYYESRILGSHHSLISTYCLSVMILYIIHNFHHQISHPLHVLHKFLEYFSTFDWNTQCLSLHGPVDINQLQTDLHVPSQNIPGSASVPLLPPDFITQAISQFGADPDQLSGAFAPKYMNVQDPLRPNNNLGRSVNQSNFFRIIRAFAKGRDELSQIIAHNDASPLIHKFFVNTYQSTNNMHHNHNHNHNRQQRKRFDVNDTYRQHSETTDSDVRGRPIYRGIEHRGLFHLEPLCNTQQRMSGNVEAFQQQHRTALALISEASSSSSSSSSKK